MTKTKKCIDLVEKENENINNIQLSESIKPKRGRKSNKKNTSEDKDSHLPILGDNILLNVTENNFEENHSYDIINTGNSLSIDENFIINNIYDDNESIINLNDNILNNQLDSDDKNNEDFLTKTIAKKRGRKPKGGKIIQQIVPLNNIKDTKPNVILHLKCSLKDLQNNNLHNSIIESYNFQKNRSNLSYEVINIENENDPNKSYDDAIINNKNINTISLMNNANLNYNETNSELEENEIENENKDIETKNIWKKLKQLEHNLHINNISDKKSACFWCTYEFDNPPVYIPKHYIKESYHVYGCFCSPECGTAFLMEENIDSSSKFERYHLINHIYTKIYDYKKNIKPAPNPYYMLDKYYGNLTIQEYRSLLRNERLFLIVDKPLTRILPELHEDNDDFIINNKIIPSNSYQIKKKLPKKNLQTKNTIVNEKFGLYT
jgi:hypothetical protein